MYEKDDKLFRYLLFLVGLVILLAVAAPSAFAQYFTIDRFHSDIKIHENGDVYVTETIEVLFSRQRHGIYRDIPYKYKDEFAGKRLDVPG